MQRSPDTLIYRRFDLQRDLPALVALLQEVERVDQTGEEITETGLREQLTWSGEDPALMTWVATLPDDASLVGYGRMQKTPHDENADLFIAVHPSWRRQGIGGKLFAPILERAGELHARALRAYANIQHDAANRFVRSQGFAPVASYTRLRVSALRAFPAPLLPQGFSTRSYAEVQRIDLYTAALNRGYEGLWGHLQSTPEEVAQWLPQLNPAGIFLLFAPDGALAGACRGELSEHLTTARGTPTGLLDAPGIVPEYRDADLALPLLLVTLHWLLSQQPQPTIIELESWGDAPATLALYRSLGFEVTVEEVSYRRTLE
jgi:mycothiol synthase